MYCTLYINCSNDPRERYTAPNDSFFFFFLIISLFLYFFHEIRYHENQCTMQYGDESAGEFMVKNTHPAWRPHLMQGWTTDFIPKIVQDAIDAKYIDDVSI